ncbi:MAG TPA: SpoIIE family protein phosphatase [Acidobacteriaceae bacterium]|nr:SpoIIE family protein phosphatase [Acidobacteriaceae bacterium]
MFRAGLLIAILLPVLGAAQTSAPRTPSVAAGVEQVRLGDSVTPLVGPWKFHTGDDPAWSQPGFDDSSWSEMDMTPPTNPKHPSQTFPLPGWTARGYPGYTGYAWYRLTIDVQSSGRHLAVKMPDSVDDAYQVFVNGTQIGQFGKFNGRSVTAYATLPRAYTLPRDLTSGKMTLAIRLWMDSATPFSSPDAGGLHGPPMLGYSRDIAGEIRLDFDDIAHFVGSGFLESLILIMALLMAAALYWLDPHEEAYFWLALVCLVTLLGNSVVLLANFTTPMGQTETAIMSDVLATPIRIGLWVMFWAYWFRLPKLHRIHGIAWALVALLSIGTLMLRPPLYGQKIPVQASSILLPTLMVLKLGLGVLLVVVAYMGFKRRKAEGGLAAAAIILAFVANFQRELRLIHIALNTTVFGFRVSLGTISTILSLLIITIMLLSRFVRSQRLQEQWRLEIEQARSIQHVLIPDQLPAIKGMRIRSEYHPAREVGGDFFQILPLDDQGSALIVVGDVTGKGLQAGMLVSLIVGAIRMAVQQSTDPSQILSMLNEQLAEREHASATCEILRISPEGAVTLAHAGHPPPYLNAIEIHMEGALPLGMIAGIGFPSQSLQLQPGDELTLISDGVAEAQDSHGRLFGFDRVQEMMKQRATADEIATAAKKFGQADDITVLQIKWQGQSASVALAAEPQLAAH